MNDITPERLAQIKARIEALPRGSWKFTAESPDDRTTAEFFDAARQDIPDLIAALEAAQAENAKLREALRPFAMYPDDPAMGDHKMTGSRISYGIIRAAHAALEQKP